MEYDHQIQEFYGDKIDFFVNDKSVLIGAGSLVSSIGLSWSGQLEKIKRSNLLNSLTCKIPSTVSLRKVVCLFRNALKSYFDTFDLRRIDEDHHEKIDLYRREFIQFAYDSVECSELIDIENRYTEDSKGIESLIYDSVVYLGNPNAVSQIATAIDSLLNIDHFSKKLPYFEKEHCPQTRKAFEQMLIDISLEISKISDPIIDMAEKTADRQGELREIKSKSRATRIIEQSEILRELKGDSEKSTKKIREVCLTLNRLSKSV